MTQRHSQRGVFNITTNAADKFRWLTMPRIPEILVETLGLARDIHGIGLHGFCILPNHMHLILTPGYKGLSPFMKTFKENCTKNILDHDPQFRTRFQGLCTAGNSLWQRGFHDERIRDGRQFSAAMGYVLGNAARHGLVQEPADWPWSSLHFPEMIDPSELWLD